MAAIQVPTLYRHLVKLVAHAFYGGDCPPKEYLEAADPAKAASAAAKAAAAPPRPGRQQPGTSGLGIILLTALTERQWVKEDDLAADLHLHAKMVRKAMRYLEEEQLVRREHRKETLRAKKKEQAALEKAGLNKDLSLAVNREGQQQAGEGEEEEGEPHKVDTITYCALDYPRLVDMLTYRLAVMAQKAQKVGGGGDIIQQYRCTRPDCRREYNSYQMVELLPVGGLRGGGELQCSVCGSPVELLDDGTEANRKARVKKMEQTRDKLKGALKPIQDALDDVKSLPAPDFDTYAQWLTHQVVLQQSIQQGPAPGSSGRSQYDRTPAVNLDNLQLVVDVGPAAGGSTSAAAGRGPGGVAAANGGAAAGRGGAAGGEAGRPGPRGLGGGLAASSSSATNASSSKAPPPWLGKSGAPGAGPSGNGVAAAAAGSSAAALTEAQRKAAFLQQGLAGSTPVAGNTAAAVSAPGGKPAPPWLVSSVIGGGAARPGAPGLVVPRPALLGAMGLGAGLAAGLGGLLGLKAGLKAESKPEMKRQWEAGGEQQQDGAEQGPDRKRIKPDPDYVKPEPQDRAAAAAAVAAAQARQPEPEEAPPTFDAMDDTEWVDVEDNAPAQQPAAGQAAAPGPESHPIDAGDDVEWEDL